QMKERVATLLARRGENGTREEEGSGEEPSPEPQAPSPVSAEREGLAARLPRLPAISTFHSFCVRALRRDIDRLGYSRDFSIYDDDDQQKLIKAGIEELGLANLSITPRASLSRISY